MVVSGSHVFSVFGGVTLPTGALSSRYMGVYYTSPPNNECRVSAESVADNG